MKWFSWSYGRQKSGYMKMKLFELGSKRLGGVDLYLIKYKAGDYIVGHVDPVDSKRHFRLNIELKKAKSGGELWVVDPIFRMGPITLFRSDKSLHGVGLVKEGTRIVLSFGLAI